MAVSDVTMNGLARLVGLAGGQPARSRTGARLGETRVSESLSIDRPVSEVYRFWRDLTNAVRIFPDVEQVQVLDDRSARWTVRAPRGSPPTTWDLTITEDIPNERIAWRATAGLGLEHSGSVGLCPSPRGTGVRVILSYQRAGADLGGLLGDSRTDRIRRGLRNVKSILETGEAPSTAGQPRGRCGRGGEQ